MYSKDHLDHLANSKMTYWYHLKHSGGYGLRLIWLGVTSIYHAVFPGHLRMYSARGVVKIYREMKNHAHLRRLIEDPDNPDIKY